VGFAICCTVRLAVSFCFSIYAKLSQHPLMYGTAVVMATKADKANRGQLEMIMGR